MLPGRWKYNVLSEVALSKNSSYISSIQDFTTHLQKWLGQWNMLIDTFGRRSAELTQNKLPGFFKVILRNSSYLKSLHKGYLLKKCHPLECQDPGGNPLGRNVNSNPCTQVTNQKPKVSYHLQRKGRWFNSTSYLVFSICQGQYARSMKSSWLFQTKAGL